MIFNFQADDLDILQGIVEESSEHLNGIEEGILRLENDFNPELLDSIFRAMHSVKGVASFVDFIPIKDTAHVLESFMTDMKKGLYACNTELTDILLRGVDILNVLIGQLALSIQNLDLGPGQENFEIVVDEGGFQSFINEAETLRHLMEQGEPPLAASADEPEIGTGQEAEAAKTVSNLMKMELSPLYEQMIGDFIEESSEHLETIEQKCVELEKNSSDPEILNSILRGFHSIKGGAGVIASMQESDQAAEPILAVKKLTHAVESLLQSYRNESIAPPTNVIDLILNVVDKVAYIVKSLDTMEEIDLSIDQLMERVNAMSIRSQEEINQQQAQTADKQVPQQFTAFINISTQALESMAHIVETVRQNKPG
ncbi:Hpt domain-containing protein [Syntrophomonas palmitatica]|uniref:Hpt domain-containing protein n=1 Tax=Syntrophomonas palmitatica TaxID=402877 RepID=UPI000A6D84A8|nr:Hpt domain-containing protein [Syntrophomonas palmitatica]